MTIETNRDLYLAIAKLCPENEPATRSLEAYLRALLLLGKNHAEQRVWSLENFLAALSDAFVSAVPEFEEGWRAEYEDLRQETGGYAGWQRLVKRQIVDLHEMDEQEVFRDKYRYLGTNAPRGSRWYNFDPCTFLECAVAGTFRGWQEGDDTAREYVPGTVMVRNAQGELEESDPRDLPDPIYSIAEISWEDFCKFLWAGQLYE